MAVNIYRVGPPWEGPPPSQTPGSGRVGNFGSLRTYYKSALRALEALLLCFIFFSGQADPIGFCEAASQLDPWSLEIENSLTN